MKTIRVRALSGLRFVAAMMVFMATCRPYPLFENDTRSPFGFLSRYRRGYDAIFRFEGLRYVGQLCGIVSRAILALALALWDRALYKALSSLCCCRVVCPVPEGWANLFKGLPDALLFIALAQAWIPGSIPTSAVFAIPKSARVWSISVEMFLYLCFPAIALLLIRVRSRRSLLGLALSNVIVCIAGIWLYGCLPAAIDGTSSAPNMPVEAANM
jgi:peptidoglycan/LPS O-acetylase OafA/YrhL